MEEFRGVAGMILRDQHTNVQSDTAHIYTDVNDEMQPILAGYVYIPP